MNENDIKKGTVLKLKFKEGCKNKEGQSTIISKSPCGRIALLHFDNPKSKQVTDGSTWECIVEYTFSKKIVVRPITLIPEAEISEP